MTDDRYQHVIDRLRHAVIVVRCGNEGCGFSNFDWRLTHGDREASSVEHRQIVALTARCSLRGSDSTV